MIEVDLGERAYRVNGETILPSELRAAIERRFGEGDRDARFVIRADRSVVMDRIVSVLGSLSRQELSHVRFEVTADGEVAESVDYDIPPGRLLCGSSPRRYLALRFLAFESGDADFGDGTVSADACGNWLISQNKRSCVEASVVEYCFEETMQYARFVRLLSIVLRTEIDFVWLRPGFERVNAIGAWVFTSNDVGAVRIPRVHGRVPD